jgi:DNA-binding NtrC family response regulator
MEGRLLVVDDEKVALKNLEHVLRKAGYDVVCAQSGQAALSQLARAEFDIVLTDLRMEKVDGMQVLRGCRESSPGTEVIVITGYATIDSAVDAMRHGAFSYIAKPYRLDEVRRVVAEAMDRVHRRRLVAALTEGEAGDEAFTTRSPAVQRLINTARQVAALDCPVLIVGEQGTGRRACARLLHAGSPRAAQPLHLIRCSAHELNALDAMLFGPSRPAEGTLLLEEIEQLPLPLQARLALSIDHAGGDDAPPLAARLVATTAADLHERVKAGQFRADLHLLLGVVTLTLPPLGQRREDVPALALYLLARVNGETGRAIQGISDDALELLAAYDYPGNLRELQTIIRGAVAVCDGSTLEPCHLPPSVRSANSQARSNRLQTLEEREHEYIIWVLEEVNGNQTVAARVLGIDRASLWRKLKRYEAEASAVPKIGS